MKLSYKKSAYPEKLQRSGGFTLVEMMVAIAVFSIVMVTAMSALLNVIDANSKARSIKTAINNISFALEGISKDMRVGTNYRCLGPNADPLSGNCPAGSDSFSFKSSKAGNPYIYYRYVKSGGLGQIQSCVSNSLDISGSSCSGIYTYLTSPEVNLTDIKFYILGNGPDGALKQQPWAIITISGVAGWKKAKVQTTFNLQTSVSQRIRPVTP